MKKFATIEEAISASGHGNDTAEILRQLSATGPLGYQNAIIHLVLDGTIVLYLVNGELVVKMPHLTN